MTTSPPFAEAHAQDAPGGGTVEEPLLGLGAELGVAEAVDDCRDLRRITGSEHIGVDCVAPPLGVLRGNHLLHRFAHLTHRRTRAVMRRNEKGLADRHKK